MDQEQMKQRTKEFAKAVIHLCRQLPRTPEARLISAQVFRSGTSVGANYRAACRAKSKADFISKMGTVEEEADETMYWMELMQVAGLVEGTRVSDLYAEAVEILSMVVASIRTAKESR